MTNVALVGTWHVHFEGYAKDVAASPCCNITTIWDPDPEKGKKYADRLIGSTIIVFKERGISLDDITFDENDNITVVKRLNQ